MQVFDCLSQLVGNSLDELSVDQAGMVLAHLEKSSLGAVLHDEIDVLLRLEVAVELGDVFVVEMRVDFDFSSESEHLVVFHQELLRNLFERHHFLALLFDGQEDRSENPLSEFPLNQEVFFGPSGFHYTIKGEV